MAKEIKETKETKVTSAKMVKVKGYKDLPKSAVVTWTISVILCLIGLGLMFLDMANIFVTKTYIQLAFILVGQFINIFNIIKYKDHFQK